MGFDHNHWFDYLQTDASSFQWLHTQYAAVICYLNLVLISCVQSAVETCNTSPIWIFVLKLKTSEISLLCALMNWQPMGLLGWTINGYTLLIDPFRHNQIVSFLLMSPLSLCMYVEKELTWMEKESYTCSFFWNRIHNDRLSVLWIYTSVRFHECCYFPKMDLIPMHSLQSCDTRRYMQPCPTFLVKLEC